MGFLSWFRPKTVEHKFEIPEVGEDEILIFLFDQPLTAQTAHRLREKFDEAISSPTRRCMVFDGPNLRLLKVKRSSKLGLGLTGQLA